MSNTPLPTPKTNQQLVRELRIYVKNGWSLAHEAADRIEELEQKLAEKEKQDDN